MYGIANLDLLSVGFTVAATLVLGCSVYFSNPRSVTGRNFLYFAVITSIWGIVNYFSYKFSNPTLTLWLIRSILFFATLQSFFLYSLFIVFPRPEYLFSRWHRFVLTPLTAIVALLTLTPLVFGGITGAVSAGTVANVVPGPALPVFGLFAVGLVLAAVIRFVWHMRCYGKEERKPMLTVLIGTAVTFALIITFNFIFAAVLNNPSFVPLGALFFFPFVAFTAFAILRQHLFSVKVIATASLVFVLAMTMFFEVIFSDSFILLLFRTSIFLLVLIFGINLIQSVLREVEQRERIERLAKELEQANEQQVVLIHFITHQIKGFVAKSRNIFSMLLEGDYGPVPDTIRPMLQAGFESDTKGAETIQEILNASNIKSGKVSYKMEPFDLKALIDGIANDLKPAAAAKGLAFNVDTGTAPLMFTGDSAQLVNAFKNLLDNSIKYTPKGEVNIRLHQEGKKILFTIHDTGVGITPEDMKNLFTEGGHGKESVKVNVESTGFGLYIVKNIVVAHNGRVWAESEGAGKGSSFFVELPI